MLGQDEVAQKVGESHTFCLRCREALTRLLLAIRSDGEKRVRTDKHEDILLSCF